MTICDECGTHRSCAEVGLPIMNQFMRLVFNTDLPHYNRENGLCLKEEWVSQQLRQRRPTPLSDRDRDMAIQDIFRQAMFSDFNHIATASLPPNLDQLHDVYLKGPFIIQIDEMFNIAAAVEKRYVDGTGRMLKIFATDGYQNVSNHYQ